jgi:hypothetical protein
MPRRLPSSALDTQTVITAVAGTLSNPQATLSGYWKLDQKLTGDITGTAGKLAAKVKLNGEDFDGSANITIPLNTDTAGAGELYPVMVTGATANNNQKAYTSTSFKVNPGANSLTVGASTFSGTFSGTSSGTNTGDQTLPTLSSLGGAALSGATFTGTVIVPTLDAQGAVDSDSGAVRWYIPGTTANDIFRTYQRASDNTLITQYGSFGAGTGSYDTVFSLDSAGNVIVDGNVTAYSDITLKDNIETINNALNKVNQVRGVTYTRRDLQDKQTRYTGVIAQEIESVLPEAVMTDSDGVKSVAYGNVIGLLIESIKELDAKVDKLQQQLDARNNG